MSRSSLKKVFALGLGAALLAWGPAQAQEAKRVRAQLAGAFPSSMLILGDAQKRTVDYIKRLSNGTIDIKFFEPGALVPGSQYFDAVSNGSLDMAYTAAGYFTGKDIAFAMFTTVPFGPDASEFYGWFEYGGGNQLMQDLHAKYNIVAHNCGLIPPEASGWFRKEIKTVDDFKGLKMRFFGLGAKVMQKLGVDTQLLAAADIYPALERGTIDATEFSQPAIDLKLGFYQVAKHYYLPGWHQPATAFELLVNKGKWEGLSDAERAMLTTACRANFAMGMSEGEAIQGKALAELESKGVTIHRWPNEILDQFRSTWEEVAVEEAGKDAAFKEAWDSLQAFRTEYKKWGDLGYVK